jgi:hypothetical protein
LLLTGPSKIESRSLFLRAKNNKESGLESTMIIDPAKVALQTHLANSGLIAYGANTHNGIVRTYNEDRISIVLDLKNPTKP